MFLQFRMVSAGSISRGGRNDSGKEIYNDLLRLSVFIKYTGQR
jgi:hypothetical protein